MIGWVGGLGTAQKSSVTHLTVQCDLIYLYIKGTYTYNDIVFRFELIKRQHLYAQW